MRGLPVPVPAASVRPRPCSCANPFSCCCLCPCCCLCRRFLRHPCCCTNSLPLAIPAAVRTPKPVPVAVRINPKKLYKQIPTVELATVGDDVQSTQGPRQSRRPTPRESSPAQACHPPGDQSPMFHPHLGTSPRCSIHPGDQTPQVPSTPGPDPGVPTPTPHALLVPSTRNHAKNQVHQPSRRTNRAVPAPFPAAKTAGSRPRLPRSCADFVPRCTGPGRG